MEGVGPQGRMFLLRRPDQAEIEARLWKLYFEADKDKEDYKNRLKYKVGLYGVLVCVYVYFRLRILVIRRDI